MALYEARGERCWQGATHVAAHEIASAESQGSTGIYSKEVSVLLERRCKRGGGYRIQAKLYRPGLLACLPDVVEQSKEEA